MPQRVLATSDRVKVALELTPANGPQWLGERRRQPTQVDAAFIVRRHGRPIGYLLVEVKLGERRFGSCRGARKPSPSSSSNPDPDRCRSLVQILAQPESQCWLAETQGRRYWQYLREETGPFRFEHLPPDAPCPFSGRLYQLMRNRVLAHALVREGGADWADVGLCIQPANNAVDVLEETVGGERSAQEAFRSILRPDDRLVDLAPRAVIDAVLAASPQMSAWAGWVRDRYQL